ncbi:MAG: hypothetical protein ACOYMA_22315 [Bacteroidia bacterium]
MKKYALILLTFFLASCEYEAQLSYKVKNNTTTKIKVISSYNKSQTDTFDIPANDQTTIAIIGKGLSSVDNYKEKGEKLRNFSIIAILKNDTIKSNIDFLKTTRWIYNEKNAHSADYILTVLQTDF